MTYPKSITAPPFTAHIRDKVYKAVKSGELVRPDHCSQCQRECKPDGHHNDYSKPLEVIWLCRSCHLKLHRNKC